MNRYWGHIKRIRHLLLILGVIFTIALISAGYIGQATFKSCLWAIGLVTFSAIMGILPVARSIYITSVVSMNYIIFSIALRLLSMLAGTAGILFLSQVSVLHFILWLAILYPPMITAEVLIIISLVNADKKI